MHGIKGVHRIKRMGLFMLLICAGAMLSGCTVLSLEGETTASAPNLGLLQMEPFEEDKAYAADQAANENYYRVDLWLDASQVMGGINPNEKSLFPHYGRKYREGGFHYRLDKKTGWYENILMDMLGAADGAKVRVLRFGNERLPDSFLVQQRVAQAEDTPDMLRSLRRDMLTYAVDPLPTIFSTFSTEDMESSFYSLGTAKLNQMGVFAAHGGAELENPTKVAAMDSALTLQLQILAEGVGKEAGLVAQEARADNDFPLMYALQNLDMGRLSVITFDPAGLRRMSGTDTQGKPMAYVEQLLRERGVFDAGLTVGLYAFQLDYLGQIISIGPADLCEPLIWGTPIYSQKKNTIVYMAPMPRILMAMVVGTPGQVENYMTLLSRRLDADTALQGLRGPEKGELTYAANSQTVTQQPFTFQYWQTVIGRPSAGYYSQHTSGTVLAVADGEGRVEQLNGLETVLLLPDRAGRQENRTIVLRFPLAQQAQGASLDLTAVKDERVQVKSALLLDKTLPNTADNLAQPEEATQVVSLRDKVYVYKSIKEPFAAEGRSPFTLESIAPSEDGTELVVTLSVSGKLLKEGYYRLQVLADITGEKVNWLPVSWIDGLGSLDATLTNEDIATWEAFSQLADTKEKKDGAVPRYFQHAWGPYTERLYYGMRFPDCPPVYKAIGLKELAGQLRDAATAQESPLIRYVFDVFVDNVAAAAK